MQKRQSMKLAACSPNWIICLSCLLTPGVAASQRAAQGGELEEIVVTAERRTEAAQDVPVSVTVFGGEFIRQNILSPYEVAAVVPNFQTEGDSELSPFRNKITIRGLGSSDQVNPLASTSVVMYYDNVPVSSSFGNLLPQWDLERLEVLRGPQGTLFGRNAVGGAVRYISAQPTDEFEAYGQFTAGEFDLRRFEGAVSGPVTDSIKGRLSALTSAKDGELFNTFLNKEQGEKDWWGVKGIVDWEVSENMDARVIARHFKGHSREILFNAAPPSALAPNVLAFLDAIGADPTLNRDSNYELIESGVSDPVNDLEATAVELEVNYDLGPVLLTGVGGYFDVSELEGSNADGANLPVVLLHSVGAPSNAETWTGEIRLTSQTEHPLQWIAGAFYQYTEDFFEFTGDFTNRFRDIDGDGLTRYNADSPEDLFDGLTPAFPLNTVFSDQGNHQELDSWAAFAHTTFDWTDRLTTTHAVRFTHEKKDIAYRLLTFYDFPLSPGVQAGAAGTPMAIDFFRFTALSPEERREQSLFVLEGNTLDANGNIIPLRLSESADEITWRFGLDYHLTEDRLVFASISRGFKGVLYPAFPSAATAIPAGPETSIVYDVGAKTQWFDNRLQVNVGAFYNDHSGFQTTLQDFTPTGIRSIVDGIPESEIYGAELEITAVPIDNLFLLANFGILDTKITQVSPGNEAILGNELPIAEDKSFAGLVRYDLATPMGTFSPQLSWRYRGDYWSLKENNDLASIKPGDFWTADLSLGYESESGSFYGQIYWDNIFDEIHPILNDNPAPTASQTGSQSSVNQRRNWGVTVGYRFE